MAVETSDRVGSGVCRYAAGVREAVVTGDPSGAAHWQERLPDPGPQTALGPLATRVHFCSCKNLPHRCTHGHGGQRWASDQWCASAQLEGLLLGAYTVLRVNCGGLGWYLLEAWAVCQCRSWAPVVTGVEKE